MNDKQIKSIVFVSNYFNHHQYALSDAFYRETNGNYCFIETIPMEDERQKMGWGNITLPVYVKQSYTNEQSYQECLEIINTADVVIIGSAPNPLIEERIKKGKLIFRYSERILKKGLELYKFPIRWYRFHQQNPKNANIYMLCASAYTAGDFAKFGLFKNKCFKWGYFPEVKKYEDITTIIDNKNKGSILWVARFLKWKHPEVPVKIAKILKKDGYKFELNMIGDGVCRAKIEKLIKKYDVCDCVHLLGTMSPEEVRQNMERSEIFLFTSDRNEGWGAVLNESMNSGCAVVANKAIGSVPYLIKDDENGFIYKNRDIKDLYKKVKFLLDNPEQRKQIGKNAYDTMITEWNADVAAERFIKLFEQLLKRQELQLSENGPCSKTNITKE